jgi:Sigma-70, region 4
VRAPSRGTAIPFSRLTARFEDDERSSDEWMQLAAPEDGMVAAELCDLRELVARPPKRQRAVVIMRYWQDAQERDIAASLGVTLRAMRAMRARAYAESRCSPSCQQLCDFHGAIPSRTATRPPVLPSQPPIAPTTLAAIGARISPIIPRARADAIA